MINFKKICDGKAITLIWLICKNMYRCVSRVGNVVKKYASPYNEDDSNNFFRYKPFALHVVNIIIFFITGSAAGCHPVNSHQTVY